MYSGLTVRNHKMASLQGEPAGHDEMLNARGDDVSHISSHALEAQQPARFGRNVGQVDAVRRFDHVLNRHIKLFWRDSAKRPHGAGQRTTIANLGLPHVDRPEEIATHLNCVCEGCLTNRRFDCRTYTGARPANTGCVHDPPGYLVTVHRSFNLHDLSYPPGNLGSWNKMQLAATQMHNSGRKNISWRWLRRRGIDQLVLALNGRVNCRWGRMVRHRLACHGVLDGRDSPLQLAIGVLEPIGAPNAVDPPTEILQHLLTQAVAISRRTSAVVGCAIAFDRQ
ncbi:hypothetical protein BH23CHL1_BH23CHL1_08040 [soil metagenome]